MGNAPARDYLNRLALFFLEEIMKAQEICETAAQLVGGDRERQHGNKKENHDKIALMWTAYLDAKHNHNNLTITSFDVANMMELLKIARRLSGAHNIDDYIDAAGYAGVAGEIAGNAEEKK